MSRLFCRNMLILAALVVLAAFFRLDRLDELPPGLQFDVAFKLFDVLRLLQGQFAIFFPAYTGREPLFHYLSMPLVALFGPHAFSLKLSAALIGTATIPLIYGFAREVFKSNRVGLLAAFFLSISFWHVFFSRVGYRVILLVPLTVLMFWSHWRALDRRRLRDFALTGLFAALAFYTYPSSRVFPLALVLLTAYAMWRDRAHARAYSTGLAITFGVAALVAFPLGLYFAMHPDEFIGHPADVSIFAARGDSPRDVPSVLITNGLRLLGMFFAAGDAGALRNLPGRPVFDPLVAVLLLTGVLVLFLSLVSPREREADRRRGMFLLVWLLMAMGISLLSDDAPNFSRMLFAVPAIMILPAWGASELWERWSEGGRMAAVPLVVLAAIGSVSAGLTFRDYFVNFANDPGTYYAFDQDKVEISDWLNRQSRSEQIYLAPLLQQNGTISLLTRMAPLKSFESRDTIILPSRTMGKDALYAFPGEQDKKVQTLAARLGGVGAREDLSGSNGAKLLLLYRVPAKNLPDPLAPLVALDSGGDFVHPQVVKRTSWEDQLALLGYAVYAADPPGRNLEVTLFFQALASMSEDYSFSIKVRDSQDRVWGQEDKWAGDNSYATSRWNPGDVIVERFYPGLNACAPADEYRISLEAYDPATGRVLALAEPSLPTPANAVSLGSIRAAASPSNRMQDLDPAKALDKSIGEQLRLVGYTLSSNTLRQGDAFSLALFWRGSGKGGPAKLTLRLQDEILADTTVEIPPEGRGVCSFFDLKIPAQAAPGKAAITVNNVNLADVTLGK